jgi:MFS family permease
VPRQIVLASLVLSITTILTSVTGGKLSDFLRRRKVFVLTSAAVYGIALIVASLVTGFNGYLFAMGIAGIGYGAFLAVDLALVTDVLPDKAKAGKDMAVFNMSSTLANAIAPAIAPFILVLGGGSYSALFAVAGGVAILGGLTILPVRRVR